VLRNAEGFSTTQVLLWVGIPLAILLIAAIAWPARAKPDEEELEDELLADAETVDDRGTVVPESLGRYPVPPLDLMVPVPPIRAARAAEQRAIERREQALVAATGPRPTNELPGGSDVHS
jgi:NADH-quinone oxidoreductase subunit H